MDKKKAIVIFSLVVLMFPLCGCEKDADDLNNQENEIDVDDRDAAFITDVSDISITNLKEDGYLWYTSSNGATNEYPASTGGSVMGGCGISLVSFEIKGTGISATSNQAKYVSICKELGYRPQADEDVEIPEITDLPYYNLPYYQPIVMDEILSVSLTCSREFKTLHYDGSSETFKAGENIGGGILSFRSAGRMFDLIADGKISSINPDPEKGLYSGKAVVADDPVRSGWGRMPGINGNYNFPDPVDAGDYDFNLTVTFASGTSVSKSFRIKYVNN